MSLRIQANRMVVVICLTLLGAVTAWAEEGMWTFDNPPTQPLKDGYGFEPERGWLDHVRLSSVRFMDGGSGSFVSPYGLVVTNHHVAVGQLQKMSTAEKNYVADGFYAEEARDEIRCPDLEINVLDSMENVTDRVLAEIERGMKPELAQKARDAAKARIANESKHKTGLHSEVVDLYHGGEYWLYRYRKYTDVRLVFAPERQAAYFGGDSDNFTYPRYDLDVAFFRVYLDDKPLKCKHHLRFSESGSADGELVFVTGHPARTDRLLTSAQLRFRRDVDMPLRVEYIDRMIDALETYSTRGQEQQRRAQTRLFGFGNAKKAYAGMYRALRDERLMASLNATEQAFRDKVAANPRWKRRAGDAWERIEKVYRAHADAIRTRTARASVAARYGSQLLDKAVKLVLHAQETRKPDAERLDGYHDAELERLHFQLLSPAPMHRDMEAILLAASLTLARAELPAKDRLRRLLEKLGEPTAAAQRLVKKTRLTDVEVRRQLLDGGLAAVEKSSDQLIALAREMTPLLADDQRWTKRHIDSVVTPASERIAKARFALLGKSIYPDATFTLRIAFGKVAGYPMNGTRAPYKTTLFGLYDRALGFDRKGAWSLPDRFWERRKYLDLSTPVNFVCECDIVGGNSGSPVLNRQAELVGVVFDGNIESLSNTFVYDRARNRAVAVHSAYVLEALRKLYDAADLADEITRRDAERHESSTPGRFSPRRFDVAFSPPGLLTFSAPWLASF